MTCKMPALDDDVWPTDGQYSYARESGESVVVKWVVRGAADGSYEVSVFIDGDEVSASPWITEDDPYEWALQYEREDRRLYRELLAANTPTEAA